MAKKTPKKFRQARKDAKTEAKKAFSGKKKAVLKDPSVKYSADDQKILREVAQEAKRGYITTDTGERVYSKPTETAQERIARERAEAMRKYREQIEAEDGPKKKPAKKLGAKKAVAAPAAKPAAKKAPVKKAAEKKPATKKPTRAEKSAANKAAWKNMSAEERKNWKANKPGAKPAAAKAEVYSITDVQPEKASKGAKKAKFVQKKTKAGVAKATIAKPSTGGTVAIRPKGTVATTPKTGKAVATTGKAKAKPAAVAGKKPGKLAKFARKSAVGAVGMAAAAELVSMAKGSTFKDMNEINRLEEKLAKLRKQKSPQSTIGGRFNASRKQLAGNLSNFADLATFGAVGKTRRERMDELNRLIKQEKKKTAKPSSAKAPSVRGPVTAGAGAAGAASGAGSAGAAGGKGGGSKPSTTPGSTYVVKRGDTLSGIAKSAGVSLAEIRAANKKFAKNPKYKQGNMIWAGTTVKIPKKK